jgi:hypothetical protein
MRQLMNRKNASRIIEHEKNILSREKDAGTKIMWGTEEG